MNTPLFRKEAVAHHLRGNSGEARLKIPISFWVMAWSALAMTGIVIAFLCTVSYTQRTQVTGVLVPTRGIPKVVALQSGVVARVLVREGLVVTKDQPVVEITSDRGASGNLSTLEGVTRNIARRRDTLSEEIDKQRQLADGQAGALKRRGESMRKELAQLEEEIKSQSRRVELARGGLKRFKQLAGENFVPPLQVQQREEDLLDQQGRLAGLRRGQEALKRDLAALEEERTTLADRTAIQIAQLRRGVESIDLENLENNAQRSSTVLAPEGGEVGAILVQQGQTVTAGQPLFSIVPRDAPLVANLFVPSRSAGFITLGRPVLLRYQPYSYQKFGQHEGRITDISRTVLLPSELPLPAPGGAAEGYYRVVVELKSQTIRAYGQDRPLQPGTVVEGTVMLETRRLVEWVFEPLLTVTGSL